MKGFKAGLEIHQQLDGKKLFCNCPAINSTKKPDTETTRKLRAVIGETGEIDIAAAHEQAKGRTFHYVGNSEDTCLVEFDEEPPHGVNPELLKTAIIVSQMLNADIVDEIQVMRKNVVDGSNVSGFQRTMLIGRNGHIDTEKGRVSIDQVLLEEEAAQKGEATDNLVTYKLDRLGIGLLEIATDASLKDPEHVKEVAGKIGMILRSTGRVKRGLGTIRQDVNVSITGGNRTEIKGFQDHKNIPKVIDVELKRQEELIAKGEKIPQDVRKAEPDFSTTFLRPIPGAARLYPETDVLPITVTEDMKDVVLPALIEDQIKDIKEKYGLTDAVAKEIQKKNIDLEKFIRDDVDATAAAHIILTIPKDIKTRLKIETDSLKEKDFIEVIDKLHANEISKDAITDILALKAKGKKVHYEDFKQADEGELEEAIKAIVKEKPGMNPGAYMGLIMAKFQGKVDGKKVMTILKKLL